MLYAWKRNLQGGVLTARARAFKGQLQHMTDPQWPTMSLFLTPEHVLLTSQLYLLRSQTDFVLQDSYNNRKSRSPESVIWINFTFRIRSNTMQLLFTYQWHARIKLIELND